MPNSDANFVSVPLAPGENPTCHVCGTVMVELGECPFEEDAHERKDCNVRGIWKSLGWKCFSCGTTTGCS